MSPTSLHHLVNIGCVLTVLSIAAAVRLVYATQRPALADWWPVLVVCITLGAVAAVALRRRALKTVGAAERAHRAESDADKDADKHAVKDAERLRFDTAINNLSQGAFLTASSA